MKKNNTKDQKGEPRRLRLNRETIRLLNDPALLLARGGTETTDTQGTGSNVNQNCYPTNCSSRPSGGTEAP